MRSCSTLPEAQNLALLDIEAMLTPMKYQALRNMAIRPENIGKPVTFKQAKSINDAVGGFGTLCNNPEAEAAARDAFLSAQDLIARMGVTTMDAADAIIEKMVQTGVFGYNMKVRGDSPAILAAKSEKAKLAAHVLFSFDGVHCLTTISDRPLSALEKAERKVAQQVRAAERRVKEARAAAPASAPRRASSGRSAAAAKPTHLELVNPLLALYRAHDPQWFKNPALVASFNAGQPPPARSNPHRGRFGSGRAPQQHRRPLHDISEMEDNGESGQYSFDSFFDMDTGSKYDAEFDVMRHVEPIAPAELAPGVWAKKNRGGGGGHSSGRSGHRASPESSGGTSDMDPFAAFDSGIEYDNEFDYAESTDSADSAESEDAGQRAPRQPRSPRSSRRSR